MASLCLLSQHFKLVTGVVLRKHPTLINDEQNQSTDRTTLRLDQISGAISVVACVRNFNDDDEGGANSSSFPVPGARVIISLAGGLIDLRLDSHQKYF